MNDDGLDLINAKTTAGVCVCARVCVTEFKVQPPAVLTNLICLNYRPVDLSSHDPYNTSFYTQRMEETHTHIHQISFISLFPFLITLSWYLSLFIPPSARLLLSNFCHAVSKQMTNSVSVRQPVYTWESLSASLAVFFKAENFLIKLRLSSAVPRRSLSFRPPPLSLFQSSQRSDSPAELPSFTEAIKRPFVGID